MNSFGSVELSPVNKNDKENHSFRKNFKTTQLKVSKLCSEGDRFKENPNKILINQTGSQDFSIDFLDSLEKCLKNSFIADNTNNDTFHNILLSKNPIKNSYLQAIVLDNKGPEKDNIDDYDILNNLDSLIQKSNTVGFIQDSLLNRFLESRSFEQESPSLIQNENEIIVKGGDKKMDQNDTYIYQIEQILKSLEDEEKKNVKKNEIPEKKIENIVVIVENPPNKRNPHIMIEENKTINGEEIRKITVVKKKTIRSRCAIF